jgi:alpha-aminoadipate carrier protein LysW
VIAEMIKQTGNVSPQEVKALNKAKCPDCDADLDIPTDTEKGEIVSCPGCGLELEVKQVNGGCVDLQELTIEGEDWGE